MMLGVDILFPIILGIVVLIVLAFIVIFPIAALLTMREAARRKDQEHALKREMLAKGLSADEIERVIQASAENKARPSAVDASPAKGAGFDKTRLVQSLIEQGMDAAGIEQLLRALSEYADDELPAKVVAIESMVEQGMEAGDIERVIRAFQRTPRPADGLPRDATTAFRE